MLGEPLNLDREFDVWKQASSKDTRQLPWNLQHLLETTLKYLNEKILFTKTLQCIEKSVSLFTTTQIGFSARQYVGLMKQNRKMVFLMWLSQRILCTALPRGWYNKSERASSPYHAVMKEHNPCILFHSYWQPLTCLWCSLDIDNNHYTVMKECWDIYLHIAFIVGGSKITGSHCFN